ncbi:hypothetical protein BG004_000101 [Podila humilis]|nr:hypothetical protein BG004_000101 [Podila humilis]
MHFKTIAIAAVLATVVLLASPAAAQDTPAEQACNLDCMTLYPDESSDERFNCAFGCLGLGTESSDEDVPMTCQEQCNEDYNFELEPYEHESCQLRCLLMGAEEGGDEEPVSCQDQCDIDHSLPVQAFENEACRQRCIDV